MLSFNFEKLSEDPYFQNIYRVTDKENKQTGLILKVVCHEEQVNHCLGCLYLQNEYQVLQIIKHPRIVQVFNYYEDVSLTSHSQCALVMEQAREDLFSYLQRWNSQQLNAIRNIFRYIAEALYTVHEKGFAHNDVKVENILLFENDVAKLADFGFARPQDYYQQQQLQGAESQRNAWQIRSLEHAAPEILRLVKQNGGGPLSKHIVDEQKSDVFAYGVALYDAIFRQLPFKNRKATLNDPQYKNIVNGKHNRFWAYNSEVDRRLRQLELESESNLSDLKDLIQKLLEPDPQKRMTMELVLQHRWLF